MKRFTHIILLILISAFSRANEGVVQFKGTIYNESNAVLNGALVQVTQNAFLFNAFTANQQGEYKINLPVDGEYDVTISKPGYVQKRYSVSTKGVTKEKLAGLPVYTADIVLLNFYEGVDYSLFEQPINKYEYNPENNNMDYNEKYLKQMREAMREVKKEEREAIKLAREKELADRKIAVQSKVGYISQKKSVPTTVKTEVQQPVQQKNETTSAVLITKSSPSARITELLARYPQGITEEFIEGQNVQIVQRIIVKDQEAWVYQKKTFNWGGVACFRDNTPITPGIFEQETSADYNTILSSK